MDNVIYVHRRTGNKYTYLEKVINASNNEVMILYTNGLDKYVRPEKEFNQKFIRFIHGEVNPKAKRSKI